MAHTHTIALLRHCGASQAIQLEDAMEVRMRMFRADNRAWKLWKWGLYGIQRGMTLEYTEGIQDALCDS